MLIDKSFAMRRHDVFKNPYHIKELLEKYPFLKEPCQIFREMEKICETERLQQLVKESWESTWSRRILEQASLEKESNSRLREVMNNFQDANSGILALCVLPYMLRDQRTRPDHERFIYFAPESCDVLEVISQKGQSEPYLMISGSPQEPRQGFVVIDQEIICEIDIKDCPLAIISVFFVFHIEYTKGLSNSLSFLEIILLNLKPRVSSTVNNFLACIQDT